MARDPERFGRYVVVKALGVGAMGSVYLGRDELLGREVAVKTIRLAGATGFAAETFRARFLNEARAIASLSHPNVVGVFDMGIEDETPFLVMELVTGRSLKDRLAAGERLTAVETRELGVQIARALAAAHALNILHRDVKPANLLEAARDTWKLADFGVAHVPTSSLTLTGQFLGSPAYAAPESLETGTFSPASDVYALGVTLKEALGGELPASVPAWMGVVLGRATARDPAARPTAAQLASLLAEPESSSRPAPFRSRRRIWIAAGAAVLALLGAGVAMELGGSSEPTERPAAPEAAPDPDPQRSGEQQKQWERIQDKLEHGKARDVVKDLQHFLDRYPDDDEARSLLDQLRARDPGPPGKHGPHGED
jgi:serine/threonine protein kinase